MTNKKRLMNLHDYLNQAAGCGELYDRLMDMIDIEYHLYADLSYKSAKITLALGGPTIFLDTHEELMELFWGNEYEAYPVNRYLAFLIDEAMKERWMMGQLQHI